VGGAGISGQLGAISYQPSATSWQPSPSPSATAAAV